MDLNDLPNGVSVFVDANIFVYHFSGVSIECRKLFERAERKEVHATTGAHILLESLHRLMMIEAVSKGLITPGQPAKKLKHNLNAICQLNNYSHGITNLASLDSDLSRVPGITLYQPSDVPS